MCTRRTSHHDFVSVIPGKKKEKMKEKEKDDEKKRKRCRSISVELGTAPSQSMALRLSKQQAHPPSTRTRDSGQGRRLNDRLGTFTRLTRIARLRESASFFASPVGNSSWDVRSHLFSTRSLLIPSETRLSISLVQVFTLLNDSLSVTPKTDGQVVTIF